MIFAHRCGSFRAHPFAIAAGVCLVLLIVASCVVFKQRRPELFAKALGAAEEKLRTALVDAGRKEIDLATEGKDIAKRLAEVNVVAVATDGVGGVAAVGTGAADVLTKAPTGINEMVAGAATGASSGGTFSAPGCCLRSRRRLVSIVTSYCVASQGARSMARRFVPTVTLWRRSVFGGACNVSSKSVWVGSAMLALQQWALLMR